MAKILHLTCNLSANLTTYPIYTSQDVSAGGGGSDGSGSDGAGSSSAAVPSPSDLAATAAPVYLDEVPQCAGLTASQCEDLLSGEYEKELLSSGLCFSSQFIYTRPMLTYKYPCLSALSYVLSLHVIHTLQLTLKYFKKRCRVTSQCKGHTVELPPLDPQLTPLPTPMASRPQQAALPVLANQNIIEMPSTEQLPMTRTRLTSSSRIQSSKRPINGKLPMNSTTRWSS